MLHFRAVFVFERVFVLLWALILVTAGVGCSGPLLSVSPGNVMVLGSRESQLVEERGGKHPTLEVHWFGTSCYLIRLGDAAILTDPFFSHQSKAQVTLGRLIPNVNRVRDSLVGAPEPLAIFVGHTHYDHFMDAHTVRTEFSWYDVPLYGGASGRNIMAGYFEGDTSLVDWRVPEDDGAWHDVGERGGVSVRYRAYRAAHAPKMGFFETHAGEVKKPREWWPKNARKFRSGEVYVYAFEFEEHLSGTRYVVYFFSSAAPFPRAFPRDEQDDVDLAIFSTPHWNNIHGYPEAYLRRLRPRHVLPSDYNSPHQTDDGPTREHGDADLGEFLQQVQRESGYDQFESILVPGVDAVMSIRHK